MVGIKLELNKVEKRKKNPKFFLSSLMGTTAIFCLILLFTYSGSITADSISGPGGTNTYHAGTNFRDGAIWIVDVNNINYSSLTDESGSGKEACQVFFHEWDSGLSDWALIGVQIHKENGAAAFQLFSDTSPHGAWVIQRTHGIPDGTHTTWPFTSTFDLRLILQYKSNKFFASAYFRVQGETNWTLFYDCQTLGPAQINVPTGLFDNGNIKVQIDGQSNGTVIYDAPVLSFLSHDLYVDSVWAGSTYGDQVDTGKYFGINAFATIQEAIDNVTGTTINVAAGTYDEQLTINKSLILTGAGEDQTFLKATGLSPVITISTDNVTIQNLEITDDTQLVQGIEVVSGATDNLSVDHIDFTQLGAGTGANAYGIYINNPFSNLSVTETDFLAVTHTTYYRTIGIFAPNNLNLHDFEVGGSTFHEIWTGIYLRSAIDGLNVIDNTFDTVLPSDYAACVSSIYIGDGSDYNFDIENIVVANNTFIDYGRGVYVWNYANDATIRNFQIYDNTFTNSNWSSAIRFLMGLGDDEGVSVDGIFVYDNVLTQGHDVGAHVALIDFRTYCALAQCDDIAVTGNEITLTGGPYTDPWSGIAFSAWWGPFTNVSIEDNDLDGGTCGGAGDPPSSGIRVLHEGSVYWPSDTLEMDVLQNNITAFDNGVSVYDTDASQYGGLPAGSSVNINYNNIYGNICYGVRNDNNEIVDASFNWWGHATGPYNSTVNPLGMGDNITESVDFMPWLDDIYPDDDYGFPAESGVQGFYYETVPAETETLVDGTTTVDTTIRVNSSTPIEVLLLLYDQNPETPRGSSAIGKYFDVSINDTSNIHWPINITVYYTATDLIAAGLTENELVGIFYWDDTSLNWQLHNDTGVNTVYSDGTYIGYAWANAWHLSPQGVGGSDTLPPTTTSVIGQPRYGPFPPGFVNLSTPIWLNATDNPGGIGLNATYYRIYHNGDWHPLHGTDSYCTNQNITLINGTYWYIYYLNNTINFGPIYFHEECIHYLQYYSIDHYGNIETITNQTFHVDDTPPHSWVIVGDPKWQKNVNNPQYITSQTNITLLATDQTGVCNVGSWQIFYRWWYNGTWTPWITDSKNTNITFTFSEECKHYLEWYALDNLGNNETEVLLHNETFFVDDSPPFFWEDFPNPPYYHGLWSSSITVHTPWHPLNDWPVNISGPTPPPNISFLELEPTFQWHDLIGWHDQSSGESGQGNLSYGDTLVLQNANGTVNGWYINEPKITLVVTDYATNETLYLESTSYRPFESILSDPENYLNNWFLVYPTYSYIIDLNWSDNNPDSLLGYCDDINITLWTGTGPYETINLTCHVENVTVDLELRSWSLKQCYPLLINGIDEPAEYIPDPPYYVESECASGVQDVFWRFMLWNTTLNNWTLYPSNPLDHYHGHNVTQNPDYWRDGFYWYELNMEEGIHFYEDCVHVIFIWTKDNLENVGPIYDFGVQVDGTPPIINLSYPPHGYIPLNETTSLLKQHYPIMVTTEDPGDCAAGLEAVLWRYEWNGTKFPSELHGLVSYWPFSEEGGIQASDRSTINSNHGRLKGNVTWDPFGQFGSCVTFNGSDGYIDCTANSSLDMGTNDFTISAWINTTDKSLDTWYRRIVGKGWNPGFSLYIDSATGGIKYIDGGVASSATLAVDDGLWHHVVLVRQGDRIRIYVDTVLEVDETQAAWANSVNNSENFTIGVLSDGGLIQGHWNGSLDEISLWHRALTWEEINTSFLMPLEPINYLNGTFFEEYYGYTDPEILNNWWYYGYNPYYGYGNFPIIFMEECQHDLYIWAKDNVCNRGDIIHHTYYVDGTPPNITKTHPGQAYVPINDTDGYLKLSTPLNLTIPSDYPDPPCQAGIESLFYRYEYGGVSYPFSMSSLIGYWPFYESMGNITEDVSINNNTGTLNEATWAPGRFGYGLTFNGTNNYVTCGSDASLDLGTTDFSVEAWIKTNDSSLDTWNRRIVAKGYNPGFSLYLDDATGGIGYIAQGLPTTTFTSPVDDGLWHHVVLVRTGNRTRIYVDTILELNVTQAGWETSVDNNEDFIIGVLSDSGLGGINGHWNGSLDEVRLWGKALAQGEIALLFNMSMYSLYDLENYRLAGLWPFTEGTGAITQDLSPAGNNGTLMGASWAPMGWLGPGLDFDGIDDYVDCGTDPSLNMGTGDFTVEAWINTTDRSTDTWFRRIVGKGWNPGFSLYIDSTTGGLTYIDGGTVSSSTSAVDDGAWHHVVLVRQGDRIRIYVDTVLEVDETQAAWANSVNNSENFTIGVLSDGGLIQGHWNGSIDEVRLYQRVLTHHEINESYGRTVGDDSGPLVIEGSALQTLYWYFSSEIVDYSWYMVPRATDIQFDEECQHDLYYWAKDNLSNRGPVFHQTYYVDGTPPNATKEIGYPHHPLGNDSYYITSSTPIWINITDEGLCAVGNYTLVYSLFYDGEWHDYSTDSQNVTFTLDDFNWSDDCTHYLVYWLEDALGNGIPVDNETFYVDSTPPVITKTVNTPSFLLYEDIWRVNLTTTINITAQDEGCNNTGPFTGIGLSQVQYRIWNGTWSPWLNYSTNFTFTEPCQHYLEIRAVDHLGNIRLDNETFYVDDTVPLSWLNLGEPNWPTNNITTWTSIYVYGNDTGCLPYWKICYRYYQGPYNASYSGLGYCLNWFEPLNISFDTTGVWTLEWFASDGIHMEPLHYQTFTVNDVIGLPPVADPDGPYTIFEGDTTLILDGTGSTDPDGFITSYAWDLNNQGTYDIPGATPLINWTTLMAHGITHHGVYTIRVQVTDNEGNIDTGQTTLTVTNVAPTITSVPGNITGNEGETLIFTGNVTFTDPGTDTFTCTIDWGYGTPTVLGPVTSPFSLPTHIYDDNGLFTITISITDTGPGTGQDTLSATIANVPPTITGTPDQTGTEGTPVLFTAGTVTDLGADDTHTYYWDWDNDGTLDEGPLAVNTATHTWPDDYTGTVRVQVRDDDGGMDNDTCLINITNVAPTAPTDILIAPFPYSAGDTIAATAIGSTDPGTDILTYQYRFYDVTDSLLLQDWSTGNTLYITALLEGHTLQIDARAHDDDGGISGTTTVTVTPCACRKGDFNQNCMIDIFDLDAFGQAYGTIFGDSDYHESFDFDDDNDIDIFDLDAFAQVWGQTYCPCGTCAAPPWQLWP